MSQQEINEILKELYYIKGVVEGFASKLTEVCSANDQNCHDIEELKIDAAHYKGKIATYSAIGGVIMGIIAIILNALASKYVH